MIVICPVLNAGNILRRDIPKLDPHMRMYIHLCVMTIDPSIRALH